MNYCNHCNGSLPFYLIRRNITTRNLVKYLVVMKLIILLTAISLQVSATVFAQQITITAKNASLREVMQSIRKQSGYYFLFESDLLKVSKPVTVNLNQESIEKTLQTIFADQPFTYNLDGKMITLISKERSMIKKVKDFFSTIDVKGKVTDKDGYPLPGASVKANGKAAITNANGEFLLESIDENASLEISYVGYKTLTLIVTSSYMNIKLEMKSGELAETVVKGYYITTKALNTGSVSMVKGSDLVKNATGDPLIALEGRVPGLYISQTSGNAGADVSVQLRGRNSIANGNNPLYIIDGVPYPSTTLTLFTAQGGGAAGALSTFAGLNVENIDRIEVLKDADATAIYGSRGANGVILITTKTGKPGKATLSAKIYSGAGKVSRRLDLINTEEYLAIRREALANDKITTIPSRSYDLNGKYGDINKYTDWQKVFIGGTAYLTDANVSLSGGSEQTQFMFGGGYRHETSVFPGNFFDRKGSFSANINHNEGRFKSTFSVSYLNDNNKLAKEDYTQKILLSPNAPDLYTAGKKLNWQNSIWENPLYNPLYMKADNFTDNLNAALNLSYEFVEGLSTTLRSGYNNIKNSYSLPITYIDYDPAVTILPEYRNNAYANNQIKTWIIEPGLNYTRKVGNGKLESLVGATIQQNDQNSVSYLASGFTSAALIDNVKAATTTLTTSFSDIRYRYSAVYIRVGYNYQDRYLLNLTGRRDASSRFGPGRQFANFGAIGAAWIISQMDWLKAALPGISFAKLRGSYGVTGNDQLPDYSFLSAYESSPAAYQNMSSLTPTSLTNPKYGWETVRKLEAAVELGFLKNKLMLNANWYRNRTGNQLVGYGLPYITGFNTVQANLPAIVQNTGVELDLTAKVLNKNQFRWALSVNLTVPKNKLVSYPNLEASGYSTRYVIDQPLSVAFLYHYTGIDAEKKIYTFEDVNKDGEISYALDRKPVFIGQKHFGGLNNSLSYKGLQLEIFLQFVKQTGYKFIGSGAPGTFSANFSNLTKDLVPGPSNPDIEKATQTYGSESGVAYLLYADSDGPVTDASFIRLKNISLSWMLPQSYQRLLKLKDTRLYVQGQNIFTITKYNGLDPEVSFNGIRTGALKLPTIRMITAGIQVSL